MSTALQAGSSISHYRVVSPLGAGGMGEVYLARDESLERSVALKVLPPQLVKNEERVRRFIQEAKSASSLSHPNIVTIYEIGRAEASSDGIAPDAPLLHFIAMELVTGDTLKHKIHQEKADLRALLSYLAQAAEGLAKAHAAGIVHRDLKPENIMVSKDGFAKVLDFGLAKLVENPEAAADATSMPTTSGDHTREGAVLGTVSYMSPEQVCGKVVDHRADVFAFGCILYEAATRRKAFAADSDVETMHRILHDKPAPVEELNPEAPAVLRRLVRRCLAKNPEQRFQSMKDIALELAEIVEDFEELSTSGSTTSASAASAIAVARGRRGPAWLVPALAAVAVAVVAFIAARGLTTRKPDRLVAPFQNMRLTRLTSDGRIGKAALSPDGRYLAQVIRHAGAYSLWVKQIATGSQVQIVDPLATPFRGVTFSPDGNYVYYVNQETGGPGYSNLYQVPALGGTPRRLLFDIDTAPTFSPDGSRIAFMRGYPQEGETALLIANADGTSEHRQLTLKDPETFVLESPSWSPDGSRIAAIVFDREGGVHNRLALVDAKTAAVERIGPRWQALNEVAWIPDGSGLVLAGVAEDGGIVNQLWMMSYPRGEVARITNDFNNYAGVTLTADGKSLATAQSNRISNAWSAPEHGTGTPKQLTFVNGTDGAPFSVTALPQSGVLYVATQGDDAHIFAIGADGRSRALTSGRGKNFDPAVATDTGAIVYSSLREDRIPHVWRMDEDGANARQVTTGSGERVAGVSPDGRWIYFRELEKRDVFRAPMAGGDRTAFQKLVIGDVSYSPDGARITYSGWAPKGDRFERRMFVVRADGGDPIWSLAYPEGDGLHWDPSGKALTYSRETEGVGNVWRQSLDAGPPRQITHFTEGRLFDFAWAPDGTLYAVRGDVRSDVVLIQNFR